jgi:hypothetical protein
MLADPRYPDRALVRGGAAFLSGPGSDQTALPLPRRLPLDSLVTQRLWQSRQAVTSASCAVERPYPAAVERERHRPAKLLLATSPPAPSAPSRASPTRPPCSYATKATGAISVRRPGAVGCSTAGTGTAHAPAPADNAYPEEYVDPENAGQARNSANRYTRYGRLAAVFVPAW